MYQIERPRHSELALRLWELYCLGSCHDLLSIQPIPEGCLSISPLSSGYQLLDPKLCILKRSKRLITADVLLPCCDPGLVGYLVSAILVLTHRRPVEV